MYILYNLLLLLLLIVLSPYLIYKIISGKYRESLAARLGIKNQKLRELEIAPREKLIWIHAVSVGETVAAQPVVEQIKKKLNCKIIFSTVTETGRQMAEKIIDADRYVYFPLDFSWSCRRFLQKQVPDAVVIMETELWPNFIRLAASQGSKIMLANGRISDKSRSRYKYLGPYLADMLDRIDLFSMQSPLDKQYIIELGAAESKTVDSGNTKFDRDYSQADGLTAEEIRQEFKFKPNQKIIIAGSTHPDEEQQLLPVFKKIKEQHRDTVFVIVPRHIQRAGEIQQYYQQHGLEAVLRTKIANRTKESVIIVDTIGELNSLYSVAELVFVGGSLVARGGHNILEPAAQGKPVLFGPHMFNFKDNVRLVKEYGAGIQVEDIAELEQQLLELLGSPEKQQQLAARALAMISENTGAAEKNAELLLELIK